MEQTDISLPGGHFKKKIFNFQIVFQRKVRVYGCPCYTGIPLSSLPKINLLMQKNIFWEKHSVLLWKSYNMPKQLWMLLIADSLYWPLFVMPQ